MDLSGLARKMLQAETLHDELAVLETAIKDAVLQLGHTQKSGNVRATYSAGRKRFDYRGAATDHPLVDEEVIDLFSSTAITTDWRGICKHAGIEDVPFTQPSPSVTIKYK